MRDQQKPRRSVGIHILVTPDLMAAIDRQRLKEQDLGTRPQFIRKLL